MEENKGWNLRPKTKREAKVNIEVANKIVELKAAGLKYPEIVRVIERDFDKKISKGCVSNVVNGYHNSKPTVSQEQLDRIEKMSYGEEVSKQELPRLMKFGFLEVAVREGKEKAMKHFNETVREGYFTTEKSDEIIEEVEGWIESKDIQTEDEEWFVEIIKKRKNE